MDYITFIKFALGSEFAGVLYYVMEAVEIPFLSQGLIKQFGKIDLLPLFGQLKSRKFGFLTYSVSVSSGVIPCKKLLRRYDL